MRIFLHSARVLFLLPLALFALLASAQPAPLPFDTQDPELRDAFRAFLIDLLREDADALWRWSKLRWIPGLNW